MTWPAVARAAAWTLAALGLLDPSMSLRHEVPRTVRLVTVATPSLALPAAEGGTRREAIAAASLRLEEAVGDRLRVERVDAAPGDARDWCVGADACVAAGDGSAALSAADAVAPIFALVAVAAEGPDVAVVGVDAPDVQHPAGFGRVRAQLRGRGVAGASTIVRVLDAGHERGRATHVWESGETTADVEVTWWPVAQGRRTLRVEAVPLDGEITALDNALTVPVDVVAERHAVLVFEARPSWAATFVRRALEADARLSVSARSRVRPGLTVATPDAPALSARDLEDVRVVVVGGLEALSSTEVELLRRFAVRRGGAVVLVPDVLPDGPVRALMPGRAVERLVARPVAVGPLRATEVVTFANLSAVDQAMATLEDGAAASVETPLGLGRVIVSGALDAWRHREAPDAFDAYWTTLVTRAAVQTGPALRITPRLTRTVPGVAVSLDMHWRALEDAAPGWPEVSAWVTCGGGEQRPVRAWPTARPSTYRIAFTPEAGSGDCLVEAGLTSGVATTASAVVTVSAEPSGMAGDDAGALLRFARTGGGEVYDTRQTGELAAVLASALPPHVETRPVYPARSPWWLVPFVSALAAEWWWRRRRGLR